METKSLIGGLLAGAAVGVAVGMLLAPASGAKTQEKLVKGARKFGDNLMRSAEDSLQTMKDRFNSKVDEVSERSRDGIARMSEKVKIS